MLRRKPVLKEKNNSSFGKAFLLKKRFMDTIRTKIDGDAVKWEMVMEAVEQGLRIKEVGIEISGERISGGFD